MKTISFLHCVVVMISLSACREKHPPSAAAISAIGLKSGALISCGPGETQLGSVSFSITGDSSVQKDFTLGVKLLHSFEYDEAEKVFASIIRRDASCAMAYWGVAMSNFHPLWAPPSTPELIKGNRAIEIAKSIKNKTSPESAYILAISSFYSDWKSIDHRKRCIRFEEAMAEVHHKYPDDKEAATFYALALDAAADPADKSFQKQKKAGTILTALYPGEPNHPGIVHYIIHTYDIPELAINALPAAREYARIAPSSAHALHMPSHIFTRLGLWDECIASNLQSVESARCYAKSAGIKGHWDEELHGLDYLVYGYLQKGDNNEAKRQLDYLLQIDEVHPVNFKVAYAFAAIPARYLLENKRWKEAVTLEVSNKILDWQKYPWQYAIIRFTRLMGAVQTNDLAVAQSELDTLQRLREKILAENDSYKAGQVAIQIKTGDAWIQYKKGYKEKALLLMNEAADLEDLTEKHPVSPGEVIPAREWLGDLFSQMNKPAEALSAYQSDLLKHPNRFNALYGAGLAAQKLNKTEEASGYFSNLASLAGGISSNRPELAAIKPFVKR